MPRGGNHRRMLPGDPTLNYACLLVNAMLGDTSEYGRAFQDEDDALYRRHARLLRAFTKHDVSGFAHAGVPPFALLDTFFEVLLMANAVRVPRPKPLSPEQTAEEARRRELASAVTMKAHHKWMRDGSSKASESDARRFRRVDSAVWRWAREIDRSVNPTYQLRESRHPIVRRYLRDVSDFCARWRLHASWSRNMMIEHHFERVAWAQVTLLPPIISASWSGDESLVAKLPGTNDNDYCRDRERFLQSQMGTTIEVPTGSLVNLRWTPSQEEQQAYEREHNATCIVVRYEPGLAFPNRDARVFAYVITECEHRLGRPLTKREARELSHQLDPQMRAVRERFGDRGWYTESSADLQAHAGWLARKLLSDSPWKALLQSLGDDGMAPTDVGGVRRACQRFAAHAGLDLDTPIEAAGRRA